jgi:hypothetical protein
LENPKLNTYSYEDWVFELKLYFNNQLKSDEGFFIFYFCFFLEFLLIWDMLYYLLNSMKMNPQSLLKELFLNTVVYPAGVNYYKLGLGQDNPYYQKNINIHTSNNDSWDSSLDFLKCLDLILECYKTHAFPPSQ